MKGRSIIGMVAGLTFAGSAHAGNLPRKDVCPKQDARQVEAKRKPVTGQAQERARINDCRTVRIPAVVDPTPFFVL